MGKYLWIAGGRVSRPLARGYGIGVAVSMVLLFGVATVAQKHSGFPVDIVAGPAPQALHAGGKQWLIYELHCTNFAPVPVQITGIELLDGGRVLTTYGAEALRRMVIPVEELATAGSLPEASKGGPIGEGHTALIFFDVQLASDAPVPAVLSHRFSFSVTRKDGSKVEAVINDVPVRVIQDPAPLLRAPLRGSGWIAFNSLGGVDHRRSLNAVDGRERIPQRFAIDWMQLGADGRLFRGDKNANENYYDYGAEVLAVADGRVADLKDDFPVNRGSSQRSSRAITLENVLGNYVIVDLGHSRFAVYAHLKPGSFRVKLGDPVKAGQVLALLGNSGNSDAPHLHFQLVDANSGLASEGIPYELESFTQTGLIEAQQEDAVLDAGQAWTRPVAEPPSDRRRELPVKNAVVSFP